MAGHSTVGLYTQRSTRGRHHGSIQRAVLLYTMPPYSSNGDVSAIGRRLPQNENTRRCVLWQKFAFPRGNAGWEFRHLPRNGEVIRTGGYQPSLFGSSIEAVFQGPGLDLALSATSRSHAPARTASFG